MGRYGLIVVDLMNDYNIIFAYWGRMKHGNDREKTIRKIYRSELSTVIEFLTGNALIGLDVFMS